MVRTLITPFHRHIVYVYNKCVCLQNKTFLGLSFRLHHREKQDYKITWYSGTVQNANTLCWMYNGCTILSVLLVVHKRFKNNKFYLKSSSLYTNIVLTAKSEPGEVQSVVDSNHIQLLLLLPLLLLLRFNSPCLSS